MTPLRDAARALPPALALALTLAAAPAAAGVYDFSYDYGSGTIAGQIEGMMQPDGNTVFVDAVLDYVTNDGVPGPSLSFVNSADGYAFGVIGIGAVTLDGSYMDLVACTSMFCSDGFFFAVGNLSAATSGPIFSSGPSFGDIVPKAVFKPGRWDMAVPGPATLPLVLLGGICLGALRQRRRPRSERLAALTTA